MIPVSALLVGALSVEPQALASAGWLAAGPER
jgi:hypothetical protein